MTVTESVTVRRLPDVVWDYTQDYARRTEWDASVTGAESLDGEPRRARLTIAGVGEATLEHQLERRPERTSLAFTGVTSSWISGGGGSWSYEPTGEGIGTRWTQTNTLVLKHPRLMFVARPFIRRRLASGTRRSMLRAKEILEGRNLLTHRL